MPHSRERILTAPPLALPQAHGPGFTIERESQSINGRQVAGNASHPYERYLDLPGRGDGECLLSLYP
jgi:hypothetical protein